MTLREQEVRLTLANCDYTISETYTPTRTKKRKLDELLGTLHRRDTLAVTSMDRLGKTAAGVLELIESLNRRGVSVEVLNVGIINGKKNGKHNLECLKAFAAFEAQSRLETQAADKERKSKRKRKTKFSSANTDEQSASQSSVENKI